MLLMLFTPQYTILLQNFIKISKDYVFAKKCYKMYKYVTMKVWEGVR